MKENYQRRNVILQAQQLISEMYDQQAEFEGRLAEHVEKTFTKLSLDIPRVEETWSALMLDTLEQIEARTQSRDPLGARFGISSLDIATGGLRPGEYVAICAETSGGKSALALSLIMYEAQRNVAAAVFSLEMSPTQIQERILAIDGQLLMKTLRIGHLTDHDFLRLTQAAEQVGKLPIHCEEGYNMNIVQIVSRSRWLKVRHNIGLVVVDYLQLVSSGTKEVNREHEIAEVSRRLRLLALELKIPVVALSQLSDEGRLRESRAIGHDADTVIHIEDSGSANAFERNIVLKKNRNGQRGGTVKLNFRGGFMTFEDAK